MDEGSAALGSPGGRWRHVVESAHFWEFIVRISVAIWIVASALIALLIRAYDTFGIGWTVLLAVLLANVGIWVASAIKLKMSGGRKFYSTSAGCFIRGHGGIPAALDRRVRLALCAYVFCADT